MSKQEFIQYLELLKFSGLDNIFIENIKKERHSIKELKKKYQLCHKCDLSEGRNKFVYGNGTQNARLVLIGEAPGANEDRTGKVFVGKAGKLLTKMLKAIHIDREDVYITNIVKCRPPGNRNPKQEEIKACLPYLIEQLDIIDPDFILLLGKVSATTLLKKNYTLRKFREKDFFINGKRVFITYHPSALLRNNR